MPCLLYFTTLLLFTVLLSFATTTAASTEEDNHFSSNVGLFLPTTTNKLHARRDHVTNEEEEKPAERTKCPNNSTFSWHAPKKSTCPILSASPLVGGRALKPRLSSSHAPILEKDRYEEDEKQNNEEYDILRIFLLSSASIRHDRTSGVDEVGEFFLETLPTASDLTSVFSETTRDNSDTIATISNATPDQHFVTSSDLDETYCARSQTMRTSPTNLSELSFDGGADTGKNNLIPHGAGAYKKKGLVRNDQPNHSAIDEDSIVNPIANTSALEEYGECEVQTNTILVECNLNDDVQELRQERGVSPPLILDSEQNRKLVTRFIGAIFRELVIVSFDEIDRNEKRSKSHAKTQMGFPGIACRYCLGRGNNLDANQRKMRSGRYFPQNFRTIKDTRTVKGVYHHLLRCPHCPGHVKENIRKLAAAHVSHEHKEKCVQMRGGLTRFFEIVWKSLHTSRRKRPS